jgi:hypothetical protein
MKYAIIKHGTAEFDVVTEDGGVASIYLNGYGYTTMYFQSRIENGNFDEVTEGKAYCKDWSGNEEDDVMIADALKWLDPFEDKWEHDDSIWPQMNWTAHIKWHGENYGLAIIDKGNSVRQTPVVKIGGNILFDNTLTERERQILLSL